MAILTVLLSITAYSAVIFTAVMLFRLIFKKHVSPSLMYLVWFLLIARLIVPVTLDSGFSLITIPSVQQQYAVNAPVNETGGGAPNAYDDNNTPEEDTVLPDSQQITPQNTAAAQPGFAPDLPTILVAVWILGMAVMLLRTLAASIKLKARLLRSSIPVPDEWLDIVKRVQAELNVRGSVRVIMVRDFVSPALNASIFPMIAMPEQMASQSAEKIEFALRHEITHLKRKDHLVCLLLAVLRVVYWFNPVIWLASKQIKMDMETACDSAAVRPMNGEETKRYAVTVLDMYAKEKASFVLGMSLCSTRKTAERRVRGIFMRKRSSYRARIAVALLAAVMLFACFTTACQPVPENPTAVTSETNAPTATPEYSAPSETPETESSPTQTIAPTPSATASPAPSPTPTQTPAKTPSPEPVAALPGGVTEKAKFTADTDGDGTKEKIVVGVKGYAIGVYVLYAGGYDKVDVDEGTFTSAYLTRTSGGKWCLLVSVDEASEDYITFAYSFNGTRPVLKSDTAGYVSDIDGTKLTLSAHLDVIGTWDYTRGFNLKNDFSLQPSTDYMIVENWMEPLHTIRELPVEMLSGDVYTAGSLPAETLIQPISTDGNSYLRFRLEDGSIGRIRFTRGEYEAYIDGIVESEYFDNIAYSD